jgi:hypothetical protein
LSDGLTQHEQTADRKSWRKERRCRDKDIRNGEGMRKDVEIKNVEIKRCEEVGSSGECGREMQRG